MAKSTPADAVIARTAFKAAVESCLGTTSNAFGARAIEQILRMDDVTFLAYLTKASADQVLFDSGYAKLSASEKAIFDSKLPS